MSVDVSKNSRYQHVDNVICMKHYKYEGGGGFGEPPKSSLTVLKKKTKSDKTTNHAIFQKNFVAQHQQHHFSIEMG